MEQARRKGLLVHAGEGVSAGLQGLASDAAELAKRGLPVLHTPVELAAAIGISIGRLRWLTFHRGGATLVHYHRYGIPKKTGGIRAISAPKPALAKAQQWVLATVLEQARDRAPRPRLRAGAIHRVERDAARGPGRGPGPST